MSEVATAFRESGGIFRRGMMKYSRRTFVQVAGVASAASAFSPLASAQAYPSRPITMIVPLAAGGTTDVVARVLADRMRGPLGQSIIIENVTGAEGSIGAGRAARARPDGYTIVLGFFGSHVVNGAYYSLPYDVINDFVPISLLVTFPLVLCARKTMPAQSLNELIAWLKANPNGASAGTFAAGQRLLCAFFRKETGTQFTLVPYRGEAAAMQDLIAGQIDLLFYSLDSVPLARSGSIKAYAVTSDTRSVLAPEIPTMAEMGLPAVSYSTWFGFFAPKGTPRDIVSKLNAAAVEALADPAVQSRFVDLGLEVFPREQQTPEALGALQRADAEKWWPIINEFGIRAE
jgi:tripartite-type tricarboxylate transporter receptor subunit TctC